MSTIETKKYDIQPFTTLHVGGPGKVYLQQGAEPSLTIEAPEDAFDILEVTNENNKLSIRIRPTSFLQSIFNFGASLNLKDEITYRITVTEIENISFGGALHIEAEKLDAANLKIRNSGSVKGQFEGFNISKKLKIGNSGAVHASFGSVTAEEFEISASGSVKAEFNTIETESLNAHASGSMKFKALAGNVTRQKVSISGSGNYDAVQLSSQITDISISGSGKATIWAEEKLSISVSGSGNIQYQGNAEVNQRVSGSGKIKKIEPAMG